MKKLFLISIFAAAFTLSAGLVNAHSASNGTDEGMMGGGMMETMMNMMHGSMDSHQSVECGALSDDEMMEAGEEMMEQMMGHEDHERIEEAMEKDIADHDSMHTMMGMWATGCVGDEVAGSLANRYGFSQRISDAERERNDQNGWSMVIIGALLGAAAGFLVSNVLKKKSATLS